MQELINFFNNPPVEMYGAPFWAWNGKLDENTLRRQIRIMREMGFGGFFMHLKRHIPVDIMEKTRRRRDDCADTAVRPKRPRDPA